MIFGGQNSSGKNAGKEKVVVMDRFRSRTTLSPLRQAEAYWAGLRRGDEIPSRAQVDPRGLENILSQTFILERVAPGIARFRLAGQRVNELAGMEVRGMPLTAFFTADARKTVSAALENMFDEPSIIEMELQTEATRLRGSRTARMILLPLRSDLGDVSRALGVLVSEGGASKISQRFTVTECDIRPVSVGEKAAPKAASKTAPKPTPKPSVNAPVAGFAERKSAFAPKADTKPNSLMDEARTLLDRARSENNKPLASQFTSQRRDMKPVRDAGVETGADLVSRPPRGGKLKKDASHLRLVVSRD
ncbi:PAS domain protein [Tritonibacter multivorans]|uniref:PAS domain protein n=1 Tax=Tritonibacter multivorans TaxID=928856 RepID=A0A0P1GJN1_9RHOB|nr:PAS domain-containing protein [Tritonibacter multivorans]MDA7421470.1 PAS domain-containing protein [Tritonibacter multivorans]CUH82339.1 PAS domain protein [Tritonibacter multivorans]SFC98864.1 PAS domain-containing protein [Tritonibacter multivorans]